MRRLLLTGLLVFVCLMLGGRIIFHIFPKTPGWIAGVILVLGLLALTCAFLAARHIEKPKEVDIARELEEKGLLESKAYCARRAFQVQEFEDEGSHYFIEVQDSSVLFLSGQYLYDYEPVTRHPRLTQPRRFPCTEFTVRRHSSEGYVVDIQCSGTVLEPEVTAPAFEMDDYSSDVFPGDGRIIKEKPYDLLRRERLHESQTK